MSYRYRARKRDIAAFILSKIFVDDVFGPNDGSSDSGIDIWTVSTLAEKFPRYSIEEYSSAVALLASKEHVSLFDMEEDVPSDLQDPRLYRTPKGTEALLEGFYALENRKDRLEQRELYYRKWVPVVTIVLSALAFIISVLNRIFPPK